MARWLGSYKGNDMFYCTAEDFRAMQRRERGKIYVVNGYMVLNDSIIGTFGDDHIVRKAPEGSNIYDTLGVEKPVRVAPPKVEPKRKRAVAKVEVEEPKTEVETEAEEPKIVDTLVE